MVEYGVEDVCARWAGYVLNLHSAAGASSASARLVEYPTSAAGRTDMRDWAARRIRDRHRLVAMGGGAWLPSPHDTDSGCRACDCDRRTTNSRLPAPCPFHCQMERHWDCVAADGSGPCPLLAACDQHDKYVEYERVDLFNRLREALLDEEEEIAAAEVVREALAGGDAAGLALDGFTVADYAKGRLRLEVPPDLRAMEWAGVGSWFEVLRAGRRAGLVRFQRSRDEFRTAQFLEHRAGSLRAWPREGLALRRVARSAFPVRSQLKHLELLQRSGEEPVSLQAARPPGAPLSLRRRAAVAEIGPAARVVVVDAPGRASAREALREILRPGTGSGGVAGGRLLLIAAGDRSAADFAPAEDTAELSSEAFADAFDAVAGDAAARIDAVASAAGRRRIWIISPDDFFDGAMDSFAAMNRKAFDDVVIAAAEWFPLIGLTRCLAMAGRRVVLVGDSAAAGPFAHSPAARISVLFQNPVRLLTDAAELVVPAAVREIDLVRLSAPRGARGAAMAVGLSDRVQVDSPVQWHFGPPSTPTRAAAATHPAAADLTFTSYVPATVGRMQVTSVELTVQPQIEISARQLRSVFKSILPQAIEALDVTVIGRVDRSLLGCRATISGLRSRNTGGGEHEVTVVLPASGFPFVQEQLTEDPTEAAAVVAFVEKTPGQFHATSPFLAQCRRIARLASQRGVADRLRVLPLDAVGAKPIMGDAELLISVCAAAAANDDSIFPYPLNDTSRLAPMFFSNYVKFHVFCPEQTAETDPLL